jgi:hypothetical protein
MRHASPTAIARANDKVPALHRKELALARADDAAYRSDPC